MKIAVLDDYQNVARDMADWSGLEANHQITFFHDIYEGLDGFAKRLAPFDIVCIMRERSLFKADLIARLPNLKLVVTAGMRNAAIDLDACKARGIPVLGTGNSGQATPELAWGILLSMARNIHIENARMREGSWITTLGTDMQGKTLGILGLGRLGAKMAQIAAAFDMKVIAWSQNLTDEAAAAAGATRVEKAELFRQADFITIHYKLSDRSRGLVGAAELALMKPTAYLVNTSRGPIVDTDALIATLTAGRIAGAGVDVYDAEPLAADHPIRSCPRTLLTPHLGYVTDGCYRAFYVQIVESIESWLAGKPVRVLA
ncbi:MAG TPA: D-2-hydroxyacid dehydrogenase family protein [Devosiaceae bacterium]|nr:D-2-hydroxyacid dehydrogenase family protein [Devosiaceae bacterium]